MTERVREVTGDRVGMTDPRTDRDNTARPGQDSVVGRQYYYTVTVDVRDPVAARVVVGGE